MLYVCFELRNISYLYWYIKIIEIQIYVKDTHIVLTLNKRMSYVYVIINNNY